MEQTTILTSIHFNAWFGSNHVLKDINIDIKSNMITAVMGPSGCGKTTFIRCINRMHELTPGATVDGKMFIHDEDIYNMYPILLRRKVGMVFQRPNPFPSMSIFENVIAGYTLNGIKLNKSEKAEIVQDALERAALRNEV